MFDPQTTMIYLHQHLKELADEAQQRQLATLAGYRPFYSATLAALGRHMSAWGEHLQNRYSPVDLIVVRENAQ